MLARETPGLMRLKGTLYSLDLSSFLHCDRPGVVGRRRLHSDSGFLQVCEAPDLWRPFAVEHQAERGGHVRRGPGQHLLPGRSDGDPAVNAVVETILHLLQDYSSHCVFTKKGCKPNRRAISFIKSTSNPTFLPSETYSKGGLTKYVPIRRTPSARVRTD